MPKGNDQSLYVAILILAFDVSMVSNVRASGIRMNMFHHSQRRSWRVSLLKHTSHNGVGSSDLPELHAV